MSEPVQDRLTQLAQLLRQARHLGPEAQEELADLVEELGRLLHPEVISSTEATHLVESTAHLAEALHERHDAGLLAAAKERLKEAALRAETKAPMATGIARQLIETLANLGI